MGGKMERRFVKMFNDTDHWWAQRAAASGSGGAADLPDVTFAHDGVAFAGEEKTTSEPYVYVTPDELEMLQDYAAAYGMRAVVIGRFKRTSDAITGTDRNARAFYIWNPNDMETTDAGTYRGHPDDEAWAARVAEPGGSADGIYPSELTSFHLDHALKGNLGKGVTGPPENTPPEVGEADG